MAIKALAGRGTTRSETARLLGVTEGAVRHHLRRMAAGAADGRSLQPQRAESRAAAIEHWRSQQGEGGVNLAEAWARERVLLTPLPTPLPEPFDVVVMRPVGRDGLVCFEGRQYSVPFRLIGETVEVRGAAGAVQILKACAEVARHPRGTARRLVIDPQHYDGPNTERVIAPPPLGRMGRRLQELAEAPVMQRSIELYAALAEVAR
jgi:hypothetical protein